MRLHELVLRLLATATGLRGHCPRRGRENRELRLPTDSTLRRKQRPKALYEKYILSGTYNLEQKNAVFLVKFSLYLSLKGMVMLITIRKF